jgi:hypothetical protein
MPERSGLDLVAEFSAQMDTWKFVTTPDDFDSRSHDELAQWYFDRVKHLGAPAGRSERDLLIDYCHWMDNEGHLVSFGPMYEPDAVVDRFLKENPTERTTSHA